MNLLPLSFTSFTSSPITMHAVVQPHAAAVAASFTCGNHIHQVDAADASIASMPPVEFPIESWVPCWDATGVYDGAVLGDQCVEGHSLTPGGCKHEPHIMSPWRGATTWSSCLYLASAASTTTRVALANGCQGRQKSCAVCCDRDARASMAPKNKKLFKGGRMAILLWNSI